jgi:hypothetical protein
MNVINFEVGGLVWGKRATKMAIIRRARVIVSKR